jgi:hypothetical protein
MAVRNPDAYVIICSNDGKMFLFKRQYLLQSFYHHFVHKILDLTYLYGIYTVKVDFTAMQIQEVRARYSDNNQQEQPKNDEHIEDEKMISKYYDFDMDLSDTIWGDLDRAMCKMYEY